MNTLKRISRVFETAEEILFDDSSKIIIMSDCHRGDGSWADDFARNQHIYFYALSYYFNKGYTYIELGDGDELWENSDMTEIVQTHSHVFWLLSKFYREGRLYCIYGNHDIVKRSEKFVEKKLWEYYDEAQKRHVPLFKNIKFHEGLILKHKITGKKIFLLHGHQGDLLNDQLWFLARFLVRYFWRPLNVFGIRNPTRTAKNYYKKIAVRKRLTKWVEKEKHILIAGHNHKPSFPELSESPYFNDGSCVHPRCITGIEIIDGYIMLIKWHVKTRDDGTLFITREILDGPRKLNDYKG
ncbi:MAG TPA: metallophosphoesterase family protein [Defluviitaleaceae bacterium]|nr:serine/threonine protein phosphatase [Candidatus Epulonipiscium sp.]HOQ15787.1 metallophosphoesterase family protein [Defluviitaleaceae bacterium]HPT75918.1 metallophosphoesterase family protein [Defluviitaleaceae bacterium]HQD49836.1 metallophosphoesterase family protein [Defluviitaleaceae bacterium]